MEPPIRSFEELKCWQAAREVRLFVAHRVVPLLPRDERFRLVDQLCRAARSITANIAEGYGRFHYLENSKFCSIARGSATEVLDHLITAHDESMISADLLAEGRRKVAALLHLLNGYMAYLKRAAHSDPNNK
jgi:four helix bundle protein